MIKKNIIIFSCCAIISLVSWLSIKLSKKYQHNFTLNYEIKSIPSNFSLKPNQANSIIINIKTNGFKLLGLAKSLKKTNYIIDFHNINYKKNTKDGILKIPTEFIVSLYNQQFLENVEIINFSPDTLYYELSELISKKVPIKTVFKIPESQAIFEAECITLPDSVSISGNKSEIDTIHFIKSETIDIMVFNKQEIQNIKLLSPSKNIRLSKNEIDVRLSNPEKIIIKINLNIHNSMDKEFKYIPENKLVTIEYETDIHQICQHIPDSFHVEMNLHEKFDNNVPIRISKQPHNIKIHKITPHQTRFSKEKK
jgi:hypothetical protein